MRHLYIISFGICFIFTAAAAKASEFVNGFEDIPLAKGLVQIENNDFSFGNEETSYIETQAAAMGKESFKDVINFYEATLPQLGWKTSVQTNSRLVFYRENEVLEIAKIQDLPLKISIILKNRN